MNRLSRTSMLALLLAVSTAGLAATVNHRLTAQSTATPPSVDDGDAMFVQFGLKNKADAAAYGGDYVECDPANPFSSAVEYDFVNLTAGSYDVYATWLPIAGSVRFVTSSNSAGVTISQANAPSGYTSADGRTWQKIGTVTTTAAGGALGNYFYVVGYCGGPGRFDAMIALKPPATPACGDGFVQVGEECDDRNQNNADGCTNACKKLFCGDGLKQAGEVCDNGSQNGPAPLQCSKLCQWTMINVCGNALREGIEQCDDGNAIATDACNNNCMFPTTCGNGVKEGPEQCDDGNRNDNDACTNACNNAKCLDGIVWTNVEGCDDGNTINTDACSNVCTKTPVCGDHIQDYGEQCDDGNTVNGDGCSSTCQNQSTTPVCGNGKTESGEQCDDGNQVDTDSCRNNCTVLSVSCGNGIVQAGEQCDDANTVASDGCTGSCQTARCGDGVVRSGYELCDDGNAVNTDACTTSCKPARCGDGIVRAGVEQCDDGNASNADACTNTCVATTVACGNGIVQGNEQCDDGNAVNTDGCTALCTIARCGDGVVRAGMEQCDDANQTDSDGCTNACQVAACGDGIVRAGTEQCDDGNAVNTDSCTNACVPPTTASTGSNGGVGGYTVTDGPNYQLIVQNVDIGTAKTAVANEEIVAARFTTRADFQNVILRRVQFKPATGTLSSGFGKMRLLEDTDGDGVGDAEVAVGAILTNGSLAFTTPITITRGSSKTYDVAIKVNQYAMNYSLGFPMQTVQSPLQLAFDSAVNGYVTATNDNGALTYSTVATNGSCTQGSCLVGVWTGATPRYVFKAAGNLTVSQGTLTPAPATTILAGGVTPNLVRINMTVSNDERIKLQQIAFSVQGGEALDNLQLYTGNTLIGTLSPDQCAQMSFSGPPAQTNNFDMNPKFCGVLQLQPALGRNAVNYVDVRAKVKTASAGWAQNTAVKFTMLTQPEGYLKAVGETSMKVLTTTASATEGGNVTFSSTVARPTFPAR